MRIEQLHYLVEISKNKSINRTADLIHVTQPTISEAIQKLEKELGVTLLNRHNQGVYLTDAGEIVAYKAAKILKIVSDLKSEIALYKDAKPTNSTENLSIYTASSLSNTVIPEILTTYCKNNPNINVTIEEKDPLKIMLDIGNNNGKLGIFVILDKLLKSDSLSQISEKICFEKLRGGKLIALVGKSHPLAKSKSVSINELTEYPLIFYENGAIPYYWLMEILKNYGTPKVYIRTNNLEVIRKSISEGLGVALSINLLPTTHKSNYISLKINNTIKVSLGLIWPKNHCLTKNEEKFIFLLKSILKNKKL